MIRRKAYEDLLRWKEKKQGKTALLIEGARRVGKSTLAQEFGRSYKSCLFIDCSQLSSDMKKLIDEIRSDVPRLLQYLAAMYGVTLHKRDSLIVFDEVQTYPVLREMIKHFVADGSYDYIETGSLLSIRQNVQDIIIPSEEESYRLNPLDFEEFLEAIGEEPILGMIREAFGRGGALPHALHGKAARLFREYILVGGMPAVVQLYADTKSFAEADEQKRQIISLYRKDAAKFAGSIGAKVTALYDAVPSQLSKHEKRFSLASVSKNARSRGYEDAFFWLSDARIVNLCFAAQEPSVMLSLSEDRTAVKCYAADTGLLVSQLLANNLATEETVYKAVLLGKLGLNEGMLTENVVAQTFAARGDKLRFYAQPKGDDGEERMEIDFLIVRPYSDAAGKPRVSPVEVKSSVRFSTVSLDRFKKQFGTVSGTEYVIYPGEYKREGSRIFVPLYMAHCI